jgi:hypothetical protein
MQVHPAVEQCLHLVAGQEVRACFPLDSVRIDGRYPANVKEYIYPGSHSDVGGGYMPLCLGKNDWAQDDRQLARIPGYEMYCAAMVAGVPFIPMAKLAKLNAPIAHALAPHPETVKDFNAYYEAAGIKPGSVEEMHRQHMGFYFTHRWQFSPLDFKNSPEWINASKHPNRGENYDGETDWMRDTQRALIQVIAAVLTEIDRRMSSSSWTNDNRLEQPLAFDIGVQLLTIPTAVAGLGGKTSKRFKLLKDGDFQVQAATLARQAPEYLAKWRKWLADNLQAEVHDTDIEREPLLLLEALSAQPLPPEVSKFFFNLVHDSMAGFIGFGMPEFQLNGFGIAKFRRIYFGNRGDEVVREAIEARNKDLVSVAKAKRAQRAQWDLEAENFQRANPRVW